MCDCEPASGSCTGGLVKLCGDDVCTPLSCGAEIAGTDCAMGAFESAMLTDISPPRGTEKCTATGADPIGTVEAVATYTVAPFSSATAGIAFDVPLAGGEAPLEASRC